MAICEACRDSYDVLIPVKVGSGMYQKDALYCFGCLSQHGGVHS